MVSNNALDIQQQGLVKFDGIGTFTGVTVTPHFSLVGDINNGITSVSPSTATFVLTSNGVGADPSFQDVSASGAAKFITGDSGGPLAPTAGNWNIFGASTAAGTSPVTTSGAVSTLTINVQKSQAISSTDATKVGLAAFDSAFFAVDANGFVTAAAAPVAVNYTNVNHAASPYTVLSTDYYISVDCSGGTVQLNFPNAPTAKRQWIIKDRTGSASTSNITLTTPGGVVTFDGLTTYTMNSNYQAINLLANSGPGYEVY
jgi:hypothetical protein